MKQKLLRGVQEFSDSCGKTAVPFTGSLNENLLYVSCVNVGGAKLDLSSCGENFMSLRRLYDLALTIDPGLDLSDLMQSPSIWLCITRTRLV